MKIRINSGRKFLSKKVRLILFLVSITISSVAAQNITVSNNSELYSTIKNAKPGAVIIMKNGIWTDAVINFDSKATEAKPIILKAETPGKVILTGKSKLIFDAPLLMAEGLFFKGGALTGTNSENADKVILFRSDRCRLKNCAVVDYNAKDFSTYYYWVFFSGSHNRVDDCTFIGKSNLGPVIGNDYSGLPGGRDAKYNRVDHCCFENIPYADHNDREIFRIWGFGRSEEKALNGAFFTIEYNLFDHADGEGSEIISLKSNYNTVEYNTIRESRGAIVARSGNFNRIQSNFILGGGVEGTDGIRAAGTGDNIQNNYICNITGDGLILMAGEFIDSALTKDYKPVLRSGTPLGRVPRYAQVVGDMIANNTFVNVGGTDIVIGAGYMRGWPESQRVLLPERNTFINNAIQKSNNGMAISYPKQDENPPLNKFKFQPNIFDANVVYGGKIELNPLPKGIRIENPMLKPGKGGLYRPEKNSPLIGKGVEPFVDNDVEGQPRSFPWDIGADQVSNLPVKRKPLTTKDVGASWLK
jgi:poly(beta-D-mannuronate) lyase